MYVYVSVYVYVCLSVCVRVCLCVSCVSSMRSSTSPRWRRRQSVASCLLTPRSSSSSSTVGDVWISHLFDRNCCSCLSCCITHCYLLQWLTCDVALSLKQPQFAGMRFISEISHLLTSSQVKSASSTTISLTYWELWCPYIVGRPVTFTTA